MSKRHLCTRGTVDDQGLAWSENREGGALYDQILACPDHQVGGR